MCEAAIDIAISYMESISKEYESSVLKILWAYAEKSKEA